MPLSPEQIERAADQAVVGRLMRDLLSEIARELAARCPAPMVARVVSLPDFLAVFRDRWRSQCLDRPSPSNDELRAALRGHAGLIREGVLSIVPRRLVADVIGDLQPESQLWVLVHLAVCQ